MTTRTDGMIKVNFYKGTGKITPKSAEQYPSITQHMLSYMTYFANGRLVLPDFSPNSVIVADNYITAPSIYWDALAQLQPLLMKLDDTWVVSKKNKRKVSVWQTNKTVTIRKKV